MRAHLLRHTLRSIILAALLSLTLPMPCAQAQGIYIVVNASNPLNEITPKQAQALYMGRTRAFSHGEAAVPLDLPKDASLRDIFYRKLTGLSMQQLNSYWARLLFTGQTLPPKQLESEQRVVEAIKKNTRAIGYLSQAPTEKTLKTILVLN